MKRNIVTHIAAAVLSAGIAMGADDADPAQALAKLKTTITAVQAITSASSSTYTLGPGYYKVNKDVPGDGRGHTVNLQMILSGEFYKISRHDAAISGQLYWDGEIAYDGQLHQRFNRTSHSFETWTKQNAGSDLYELWASPLDQFGFICGFTGQKKDSVKLSDLNSPALWTAILSHAKLLGPLRIGGQYAIAFEISNGDEPTGGFPCKYEVDLSPGHGFFPMRWASYTMKGELFQEFTVTEFGKASYNGVDYFYPAKASGKTMALVAPSAKPEAQITREWETTSFDITPPQDNGVFTIDHSSADNIVDQDTHTSKAVEK